MTPRIYVKKATTERTTDYGEALEWVDEGHTVSEYHKVTEIGWDE